MQQTIVDLAARAAMRAMGRPVRDGLSTGTDAGGSLWLWFRKRW